jgi:hypothetical protein
VEEAEATAVRAEMEVLREEEEAAGDNCQTDDLAAGGICISKKKRASKQEPKEEGEIAAGSLKADTVRGRRGKSTYQVGMHVLSHYKSGGRKSKRTDTGVVIRAGPDGDGEVFIDFGDAKQ